jgi:16S rRNA (guanine527-N7)-methyltransferase
MTAETIAKAVEQAGFSTISTEEAQKFAQYLELLLKWNARLNLTAIREPEAILQRHFLECIQCAQSLPSVASLLDFGSGAGLPGIPIAILKPEIRVTLGESQAKKAAFLREAVRTLDLNATVFDGRIETMTEQFDAVTLRAVDKMVEASRLAQERIKPSGRIILFTTVAPEPELSAALPAIQWQQTVPIHGLDSGILLIGQKTH